MDKPNKVGLLGGSFDPPHIGHLMMAHDALEFADLDEVWFIPNFRSPQKLVVHADAEDRLQMTKLLVGDDTRLFCSDLEIAKGKSSFTIDTLRDLKREHPQTSFFWILGEDQLLNFQSWKNWDSFHHFCELIAFGRPGGVEVKDTDLGELKWHRTPSHMIEISSSEIRSRIGRSLPVYMFLHPSVHRYITEKNLYKLADH